VPSIIGTKNPPSIAQLKQRRTIFIVLSSKGAGSSALHNYLNANFGIKYIPHSSHFAHETLYWTKTASILGLKQESMYHSEVPISYKKSVTGMQDFLDRNHVQASVSHTTEKEEFFELFFRLCDNTGFPVVEKSPHHLFNFSNIQLILEFKRYIADRANVVLIGLVRNPIDTVYSAWCRWRYNCHDFEQEWVSSYRNLHELVQLKEPVEIFRYEDLSKSTAELDSFIVDTCGIEKQSESFHFHDKSVQKWKRDGLFEYAPSPEAQAIAGDFGYTPEELRDERDPSFWWTMKEVVNGLRFKLAPIKKPIE
jgi:hypothetical protein